MSHNNIQSLNTSDKKITQIQKMQPFDLVKFQAMSLSPWVNVFTFKAAEHETIVSLSKPVPQAFQFLFLFCELLCDISLSLSLSISPSFAVSSTSQKPADRQGETNWR